MWPQITYIVIALIGVGFGIARHGRVETKRNNFWLELVASCSLWYLLYAGGFFKGLF